MYFQILFLLALQKAEFIVTMWTVRCNGIHLYSSPWTTLFYPNGPKCLISH